MERTTLNSPLVPSQAMQPALRLSDNSSSRNCHSWIWPEPAAGSSFFKSKNSFHIIITVVVIITITIVGIIVIIIIIVDLFFFLTVVPIFTIIPHMLPSLFRIYYLPQILLFIGTSQASLLIRMS